MSWNHIVNVYEEDLRMRQVAPGLRKLIKLRVEHIRLTPRDRMRVKLAVQVSYLITVYCILCCRLPFVLWSVWFCWNIHLQRTVRLVYFKYFFYFFFKYFFCFYGNVGKISPESVKIGWVISVFRQNSYTWQIK